ncbi:hypothetical protein Vafri_8249, partial [Volvox africanus]
MAEEAEPSVRHGCNGSSCCEYYQDIPGCILTTTTLLDNRWAKTATPVLAISLGRPPDDSSVSQDAVSFVPELELVWSNSAVRACFGAKQPIVRAEDNLSLYDELVRLHNFQPSYAADHFLVAANGHSVRVSATACLLEVDAPHSSGSKSNSTFRISTCGCLSFLRRRRRHDTSQHVTGPRPALLLVCEENAYSYHKNSLQACDTRNIPGIEFRSPFYPWRDAADPAGHGALALAALPIAVTVLSRSTGMVLSQNAASELLLGLLVHRPDKPPHRFPRPGTCQPRGGCLPARGAIRRRGGTVADPPDNAATYSGGGPRHGGMSSWGDGGLGRGSRSLLYWLFLLEPSKLMALLEATAVEGGMWQGVVRVPTEVFPLSVMDGHIGADADAEAGVATGGNAVGGVHNQRVLQQPQGSNGRSGAVGLVFGRVPQGAGVPASQGVSVPVHVRGVGNGQRGAARGGGGGGGGVISGGSAAAATGATDTDDQRFLQFFATGSGPVADTATLGQLSGYFGPAAGAGVGIRGNRSFDAVSSPCYSESAMMVTSPPVGGGAANSITSGRVSSRRLSPNLGSSHVVVPQQVIATGSSGTGIQCPSQQAPAGGTTAVAAAGSPLCTSGASVNRAALISALSCSTSTWQVAFVGSGHEAPDSVRRSSRAHRSTTSSFHMDDPPPLPPPPPASPVAAPRWPIGFTPELMAAQQYSRAAVGAAAAACISEQHPSSLRKSQKLAAAFSSQGGGSRYGAAAGAAAVGAVGVAYSNTGSTNSVDVGGFGLGLLGRSHSLCCVSGAPSSPTSPGASPLGGVGGSGCGSGLGLGLGRGSRGRHVSRAQSCAVIIPTRGAQQVRGIQRNSQPFPGAELVQGAAMGYEAAVAMGASMGGIAGGGMSGSQATPPTMSQSITAAGLAMSMSISRPPSSRVLIFAAGLRTAPPSMAAGLGVTMTAGSCLRTQSSYA